MGGKRIWRRGEFREFKFKIPNEKFKKYKTILEIRGKTAQGDYTEYVNNLLGE
jgi:hypothetical protein